MTLGVTFLLRIYAVYLGSDSFGVRLLRSLTPKESDPTGGVGRCGKKLRCRKTAVI